MKTFLKLAMAAGMLAAWHGCKEAEDGGREGSVDGTSQDDLSDSQSQTDSASVDPDTETVDEGPVADGTWKHGELVPVCDCPGIGETTAAMLCAVDLCFDEEIVLDNVFSSPVGAETEGTHVAVDRFGVSENGLGPMKGGSYAMLGTGEVLAAVHNQDMLSQDVDEDPFSNNKYDRAFDVMEWQLRLRAPQGAKGIRFNYVFFSTEYEEFVGSEYNDKFYVFIEADSTNGGARTVINFTECRDPGAYHDFICEQDADYCEGGAKYCYIAINTALSECCWLKGCPGGVAETDIEGTGFSCAAQKSQEKNAFGFPAIGSDRFGSSTGWLATEWPVEPGEEFNLIFHIHDTNDANFDSQVILDNIRFVGEAKAGTIPI